MKALLFVVVLFSFAAPIFAESTVRITGIVVENYSAMPSVREAVTGSRDYRPLGGLGWEVVLDKVGLGGAYLVDFFRDGQSRWWMDWYGEGLFVSYHFIGARETFDPFVDMGVGCAGRVLLDAQVPGDAPLLISVFPSVGAGLNLNLEALTFGLKLIYAPYQGQIPVTNIPAYPLGRVQIALSAGVALGRR